MLTCRRTRLFWSARTVLLLALGACLTTFALPAQAADATVVCTGGAGVGFPSITAALAAIGQTGPSTITVTGTCSENVFLFEAQLITIQAGPGGAKIIGPLDTDAIDIVQSRNINLNGLDISGTFSNTGLGGGGGVVVSVSTGVQIIGCNIHGNQSVGVDADTGSVVQIFDTTIQNNNPSDGLDLFNNSTVFLAGTTIQNNGSPGGLTVSSTGGGGGVFAARNCVVDFGRNNVIQNNADVGVVARIWSTVIFGGGSNSGNTVQGHNLVGIDVNEGGHLQVNGSLLVQSNGGGQCPLDTTCGAIVGTENSTLELNAGTITGNHGDGISVEQGTNVRLGGATISNNSGDGVRIRRISIGDFAIPGDPGNTITGNGGENIFCDGKSLGIGLSGFSKVRCGEE